jgi:GT2 family glycosyltransferase
MQSLDVIFLSYTESLWYYGLTRRSIETLIFGNRSLNLNIVLVETNPKIYEFGFDYPDCTIIIPEEPFNYNRFINLGLRQCSSKYVLVCNNDLVFGEHSIENLLGVMQTNNFNSCSPYEPNWHAKKFHVADLNQDYIEGYEVQNHLTGWCICFNREMALNLNVFDERFAFWYQDDDYARSLKKNNIKHYLIPSSIVYHEFSASHRLLKEKHHEMTHGLKPVFDSKWNC